MAVPDGPGEAPEELLGGCKMLSFHWFLYGFHVFHASCALAHGFGAWWRSWWARKLHMSILLQFYNAF